MRQIVLDTETTGLRFEDGHRVIEIGCLELINRRLTGNKFHQYINPEREVEAGAVNVHGLNNEFLKDKPLFKDILDELLAFLKGSELIIHNAPFDVGFLNNELKLANAKWKLITDHCRVIDTLALARQMHAGQKNSLDALCKRYSVDNSHRDYHGALLDSHLLTQVYLSMTGGQGSLFEELNAESTSALNNNKQVNSKPRENKLTVIHASDEELIEHKKIIDKMKAKAKVIWEEAETTTEN